MFIIISAMVFAVLPFSISPLMSSICILVGVLFAGLYVREMLQQVLVQISNNQKKIYGKVSKSG